jgi:hypothetical protein
VGSSHTPSGKSIGCSSANFLMDWPSEPSISRRVRGAPPFPVSEVGWLNARRNDPPLPVTVKVLSVTVMVLSVTVMVFESHGHRCALAYARVKQKVHHEKHVKGCSYTTPWSPHHYSLPIPPPSLPPLPAPPGPHRPAPSAQP